MMKKKLFSEIPCLKGERVTLRPLTASDADGLSELTQSAEVYRYLPTFLYEKKYTDTAYVIDHLYDECLKTSLILCVFTDDGFCGLAEIYGYRASLLKASVGYRLLERCWGEGDRDGNARLDGEISAGRNRCEDHHREHYGRESCFR